MKLAALPPHYLPLRFRALALFEPRPHARVEGPVIAGVRKPAQNRTHALQQTTPSFDDLVGAREQLRRNFDPERFGGGQVKNDFEFGRLLHWDIGRVRCRAIVFVAVIDPVGAGFVESMARPGGNSTGFVTFEYAIAAKWLELLKEVAPTVTRAAVLRDPTYAAGIGQFAAIQAVGPIGMELSAIGVHDAGAIEHAVAAFAHGSKGGLIVTASPSRQIIRV
jgi:hypothetical protein